MPVTEEEDQSAALARKKKKEEPRHKKKAVTVHSSRPETATGSSLPASSGSFMSFGDFDDGGDDDASFLGGARKALPGGPWINTDNSPIFTPQWGFQEDNPGRDMHSIADFMRHVMPPGIQRKMVNLSPDQSVRRFAKEAFDNFMFSINTVHVADQAIKKNRNYAASFKDLKATMAAEADKIRLEREAFAKFKSDHEADLARVSEVTGEVEALKAKLAEQEGKIVEMEASLQRSGEELNEALISRDQVVAACDAAVAEKVQAIGERDAAIAEKQKLQSHLPDFVFAAMSDKGFVFPFGDVIKWARKQGQHEVAAMTSKFIAPTPLPPPIAAKYDPEVLVKCKAAQDVLSGLSTTPFLQKLTSNLDMTVDELLAIQPEKP